MGGLGYLAVTMGPVYKRALETGGVSCSVFPEWAGKYFLRVVDSPRNRIRGGLVSVLEARPQTPAGIVIQIQNVSKVTRRL